MSLSDEGNRPSNEQAASETPKRAPSGQNDAEQGLPGLAGFGQMPGYAPVTAQPQAPEAAEFTETPSAPEYSVAPAEPEYTEIPATPVEQPEPVAPANLQGQTYPQDHQDEEQGFAQDFAQDLAQDQEQQFDNPPGFLDPDISENNTEEPYVSDNLQSYVAGHHSENTETGGFDAGLGLNPDQALHAETGNTLQTFEAHYDQHPEIPLGVFDEPGEAPGDQPFFHEPGQEGDAEFLSGEPGTDLDQPKERKGRKILMAASGLIGVLALGGALAFAYKIGGDSDIASTGKPPLIQADNRPVKVAPDVPGGKQFPNKNKKIYERLQGESTQEVERLVPRQESVVAAATAAVGTALTADAGAAQATRATAPAGAPRKVKTLTVRPDGTIEPATPKQKIVKAPAPANSGAGIAMKFPQSASAPSAAPRMAASATIKAPASAPPAAAAPKKPVVVTPPPAPAQAAPLQTASLQPAPASAPPPIQKPRAPARPAPAAAPAASSSEYVVQVAARKSQTDALAAFADIQQQYPQLLSGYRPIIKKADLGSKGVWYRLNVGPVKNKQVASNLCSSLKSAGMRSCIIRAQ